MPTKQPTGAIVDRLRNNSSQDWRWVVPWALFNDAEEHSSREIIEAAADAIELKRVRTCNVEKYPPESELYFETCSECGCILSANWPGDRHCKTANYCPNCGAKVIS